MHHGLSKFGITVTHVDLTRVDNLKAALSDKTRMVYFETPANPNMRLVDIEAVSQVAHAHKEDMIVLVDNTYATPYLTRPMTLGADLVVHSATKYLGGHGDVIAGLIAGSHELIQEIRLYGMKDMTGAVMSPFNASLVLRGIKTLEVRMDRHCQNAMKVAQWLENQPLISKVWYPGLNSFEQKSLAEKQMADFGGMIAFELSGGMTAGTALIDALDMIHCAVSLGDTESLIQHPASMTHSTYTPEERALHGISDGLIRLSVGLEGVEDIIEDLEQALAVITPVKAKNETVRRALAKA